MYISKYSTPLIRYLYEAPTVSDPYQARGGRTKKRGMQHVLPQTRDLFRLKIALRLSSFLYRITRGTFRTLFPGLAREEYVTPHAVRSNNYNSEFLVVFITTTTTTTTTSGARRGIE